MVLLMLLISTMFVFIESLINHENLPLFHTFICISSRSFNIAICCCIWKIARSHNSSIRYLLLGDCKDFLILRILYFWFTTSSLFLSVHLCPSWLPFVSVSHHSNSITTVQLIFIMPTIIIRLFHGSSCPLISASHHLCLPAFKGLLFCLPNQISMAFSSFFFICGLRPSALL